MLDYILIAFLVLSGITFVIAEIIFIPGITVVGVLGFLIGSYGVYRSYGSYGAEGGHMVLEISFLATLVAVLLCFKSGVWKKFSNESVMGTSVNKDMVVALILGKEGVSISSLKPIGKAEFDNKEYEVTSHGNFVGENQPIKIVKLERNKIFIEPIK